MTNAYLPTFPLELSPLTVFGMMLLAGALAGYVAHRISWLPSITGFMAAGVLCGPSGLGLLDQDTINGARILVDIALALILYRLGLSVDLYYILHHKKLLLTSLLESACVFWAVTGTLIFFDFPAPLAQLVAAIVISSSPAVLLHVAHELKAGGQVTDIAKTLVALNNLLSFVMFSAVLPVLHYSSELDFLTSVSEPVYMLCGSLVLGVCCAFFLHRTAIITRQAGQYHLALVIGTVMTCVGLASALNLSMLFAPLVLGVAIKSMERETVVSDMAFGPSFELFFVVLFVFAGAGLHLQELLEYAPVVFALVLVRSLAKIAVVGGVGALQGVPLKKSVSAGMLMVPMAGLAIGLVQTSAGMFPHHAHAIAAVVLGAVTIFESVGPPIAALAFRMAGEVGGGEGSEPVATK